MNKRLATCLATLAGLVSVFISSAASATSVDRLSLCNLEGRPGQDVTARITLQGTEAGERTGYWYTVYKAAEGDSRRLDITAWITIDPPEYTLTEKQVRDFTVTVHVPSDAGQGLWGATSEDAGLAGHAAERRTYLVFKDTSTGGNVYSGLLIPVSVNVVTGPGFIGDLLSLARDNLGVVLLLAVIAVLLVLIAVLLKRRQA